MYQSISSNGGLFWRVKSSVYLYFSASACGHKNAGQELCYLCHQRDRRNIPVSFTEERRRREQEDDRLLQQYQHLKDTEAILRDQELNHNRRHENQKMAAFNLGVSEAIKSGQAQRPTEFHVSYCLFNTLRLRQNGRYFTYDNFKCEWKCLNFDWNFPEVCSWGSN